MGHSTPNSTCAAHINPKPGTPEAVFVSGLRDMCCCSSSLFDQRRSHTVAAVQILQAATHVRLVSSPQPPVWGCFTHGFLSRSLLYTHTASFTRCFMESTPCPRPFYEGNPPEKLYIHIYITEEARKTRVWVPPSVPQKP